MNQAVEEPEQVMSDDEGGEEGEDEMVEEQGESEQEEGEAEISEDNVDQNELNEDSKGKDEKSETDNPQTNGLGLKKITSISSSRAGLNKQQSHKSILGNHAKNNDEDS